MGLPVGAPDAKGLTMLAPIVRIALRYLSGFLLAKGIIDVSAADLLANDVDVQQVAMAASEAVIGIATDRKSVV